MARAATGAVCDTVKGPVHDRPYGFSLDQIKLIEHYRGLGVPSYAIPNIAQLDPANVAMYIAASQQNGHSESLVRVHSGFYGQHCRNTREKIVDLNTFGDILGTNDRWEILLALNGFFAMPKVIRDALYVHGDSQG